MTRAKIRFLEKTRLNKNGIYCGGCGDFYYICIGFGKHLGRCRVDVELDVLMVSDEFLT